jgi:sugar lactone lactonase YvrE
VIENGPKLIKINLKTDQVVQTIQFDSHIAPIHSYLNDVRIHTKKGYAYITDSGLGALIVVNLMTSDSRRVLENHPSTKSEDITLTIEGKSWLGPDGSSPKIHSDGIALNKNREYVYYQALTGKHLYRIKTDYLNNFKLIDSKIEEKVETVGETGAADGIAFGQDNHLYLTSVEHNAIRRYTLDGELETVVQDSIIKWPDSIAITSEHTLYLTTSQLHLGSNRTEPYRILKVNLYPLKKVAFTLLSFR